MRYTIYAMVGAGLSLSQPYGGLSDWEKVSLILAWPVLVVRDAVNEIHRDAIEKDQE